MTIEITWLEKVSKEKAFFPKVQTQAAFHSAITASLTNLQEQHQKHVRESTHITMLKGTSVYINFPSKVHSLSMGSSYIHFSTRPRSRDPYSLMRSKKGHPITL